MKRDKSHFFWISYSDLMTSLFFIMLVLFVLAKVEWERSTEDIRNKNIELEKKEKERLALIDSLKEAKRVSEEQLQKIRDIQEAVKNLPPNYFKYDSINKRFSLKRKINFLKEKYDINYSDKDYLISVGEELRKILENLKKDNKLNVKYILIIEGMASRDYAPDIYNYNLSYNRALAVRDLWFENGIKFDKSIDVQIAGSGTGGIGRVMNNESENQQILIHIIPKIDEIK